MRCAACAKGSLIEIRMTVAGEELTFRRCGRCEAQAWTTPEGEITLGRVLELARSSVLAPGVLTPGRRCALTGSGDGRDDPRRDGRR